MKNRSPNQIIVHKPSQLNENWAQSILNIHPSNNNKAIVINKVDVLSVDVGTTTRVRLAVDHNGADDLPKRWFVKMPSMSYRAKAITALPRLLPTEVRFYNELAGQIPVNKPQVIGAHSRFGKGSTLVLNDVSEMGAVAGKAGDALSAGQAMLVVEHLANFHGHFISKTKNDPNFRWLTGPIRRLEDGLGTALAVPLMKRGLRLASDWMASKLHSPALRYARRRKQVMQYLSKGTPTLVHHDCHPGNIFWHNGQPGFLDWQMVRVGEEIGDVSYFLATALAPEIRRANEFDLLGHYHDILRKYNASSQDFSSLVGRYRAHLAYPFEAMTLTLAVGGMMPLESNLEMIRRAAIAVEDHDTFAMLP